MITKIKVHGYRKYRDFTLEPNRKLNLIVGANESGKSTLLEAIALGLTGRINGRWAAEELNPYWFNLTLVRDFIDDLANNPQVAWPEIRIELFLENRDDLQQLCGAHNSDVPTNACPGVSMRVIPNSEYDNERQEWLKEPSLLLPVEYYMVDWRSFADFELTNRPRQLATAIIDSRTVRSSSGVDYHMRYILNNGLKPAERAAISVAYRKVKESMSETALKSVNERIAAENESLNDLPISLAMDQSARTTWEGAITPHVNEVPFAMSGQGQQAAIKIALAMSRHSESAAFVMVEEPENHLTHTSLNTLLSRIETLAGDHQQLFVATHSSFVINRLGLDSLHLLEHDKPCRLSELPDDTVTYFQKLPGYDTLRMALADKIVLVEGASDEILFERFYSDIYGNRPIENGIDVLSMRGLSLKHCLKLCAALDKKVAAIRDNDGADPDVLSAAVREWLVDGRRQIFIGAITNGQTLEPQLISCNEESRLRAILGLSDRADLLIWMTREKTEAALRISLSDERISPPEYMRAAAEFIHG